MKRLEEIDGERYGIWLRLGFVSKRSVKVRKFEASYLSVGKKSKESNKVSRICLRGVRGIGNYLV